MLGYLKDIFFTVPILILSATINLNIFNYIRIFLKQSLLFWIYKQPFDWQNLRYMIYFIRKSDFQNLVFFISRKSLIREISKIIIFVDKIEDVIALKKYLQSRLLDCVQNRTQAYMVIRIFISNLDAIIRIKIMENLQPGNIQIYIYTKYTSMSINILDIIQVIQFKISDFISLPKLL